MKRSTVVFFVLMSFVASCSSNVNDSKIQKVVDNEKACRIYQKALLDFIEIGFPTAGDFWSNGIRVKTAAQFADPKLKAKMLIVANKFRSTKESDIENGTWSTTKEEDQARDFIIKRCESLGFPVS